MNDDPSAQAPDASFFYGAAPFETSSFWIGCLGVVLAIVGFALVIWQLWKTRNAAEAAEEASNRLSNRLEGISTLVRTVSLCGVCEQAVQLITQEMYVAAAFKVFELQGGVAKLKERLPESSRKDWQKRLVALYDVHARLQDQGVTHEQAARCTRPLVELYTELSAIQARVERKAGEE